MAARVESRIWGQWEMVFRFGGGFPPLCDALDVSFIPLLLDVEVCFPIGFKLKILPEITNPVVPSKTARIIV